MDSIIFGSSVISTVVFIIGQIVIFRSSRAKTVLKRLVQIFVGACVFNGLLFFVMGQQSFSRSSLSLLEALFFLFLSILLLGLMAFCYVVCVFGPYESSIRMRLLRELLDYHPQGASWEQITQRYNDEVVLKNRLDRLVYAGDIAFDGRAYSTRKQHNVFGFMNALGRLIKIIYKI